MVFQPSLPFDAEAASAPDRPGQTAARERPTELTRSPAPEQVRRPERSRLIEELARVCAEHPLDEKILVSPSLLVGHQIVERLARAGRPVVHLRVETLRTLAHAVAGPALAREGLKLISRAQSLALVEQACAESLGEGSYFGELADRPGFHRALQRVVDELRAAGIAPQELPDHAFSDPRKPRELRRILESYRSALDRAGLVDRAEVLRRAAEMARPMAAAPLYLLPEGAEPSATERRLLDALAGGREIRLATDLPAEWRSRVANARVFRAVGEENEIRAVFRDVLAGAIPFDEVEVLHTDAATYPTLAFELASEHGVPATFSGGIAVTLTNPGQAALAFLGWVERGFEAEMLREALAGGVLSFPEELSSRSGPLAAAREMRRARIGWGRQRHLPALDRLGQEIAFAASRAEDEEDPETVRSRRKRRLAALGAARIFVSRALSLVPSSEVSPLSTLARGARSFVAEFSRVAHELDAAASSALSELFSELESLPGPPARLAVAAARLADAVRSLDVAPERPRPGRIHFAEFSAGGFSGRSHTFLIGLDEKRHPGQAWDDPVLSDQERRGINEVSAASLLVPDRSLENALALQACVARLRGSLSFGYSGFNLRDLANPGEVFPSPFLLDVYRAASGDPRADYERLAEATGEGDGFVPEISRALDETEWWLARIGDRRSAAMESAVGGLHCWLGDGLEAERARRSGRMTPWDAVFSTPTPELDPRVNGEPISASRIQALAECPFGYFLQHVLRLVPPDEPEENGSSWLDARGIGSLIHRVFRRFCQGLSEAGRRPAFPSDLPALAALAEEELAVMRQRLPPRSELAFGRRRDEVQFACRTFLVAESARAGEAEPVAFEVAFGIAGEGPPGEIRDPVDIALGDGRSFRLRGSIDRVDRDAAGQFQVWDYKTGAAMYTREELGIAAGRQIQPALYALAWESLQASGRQAPRAGSSPARVARSGYFFPGRRGLGERFAIAYSEEETRRTLDTLFDLLASGAFPHAPDKDSDCFVCRDLPCFCPDPEEAGRRSRNKLADETRTALIAWRKLRG